MKILSEEVIISFHPQNIYDLRELFNYTLTHLENCKDKETNQEKAVYLKQASNHLDQTLRFLDSFLKVGTYDK